ncbi:DUF4188 domain-containing protein [Novosphingobium sp. KCTC 2891]|uniref:DUF4188 domain-containing protein n=1 Tax=Novosphingobium sp. KCTC 2891 TaxID=2989730 RepID=UPI0022221D86|nr:DUF4188 domain-containing protein [Novosphingobium sp. KCTC 2891]MCW1384710.1 DUF4188 domain-containing protein [Novosphingobium sp. KCTC 2891]
MTTLHPGRFTAAHEGPLVVFLIGMRINRLLRPGKWLPVVRAMGPMLTELSQDRDSGFLGYQMALAGPRTIMLTQYWRDFDSLETYARARDRRHWPAWTAFNKAVGNDGTVGIFHETYAVAAGAHETIYGNMPPFGLGKVAGLIPATGSRAEARSRMKAAAGD